MALELEARLDNLLSTVQREMADVDLFIPIPEREECPICMIPLPISDKDVTFMTCCGKDVCCGCTYKNMIAENKANRTPELEYKCAFCRQPAPDEPQKIKALKRLLKRNSPEAFMQMACEHSSGENVFQSDTKALEMYIRAAELGNAKALWSIGTYCYDGIAVEGDVPKSLQFFEAAAKKGNTIAHRKLAYVEETNGNMSRSIKHLTVAASAGCQESMDILMKMYRDELLSKEELTRILRAYQVSNDKMKSKDRDDAKGFFEGLF